MFLGVIYAAVGEGRDLAPPVPFILHFELWTCTGRLAGTHIRGGALFLPLFDLFCIYFLLFLLA